MLQQHLDVAWVDQVVANIRDELNHGRLAAEQQRHLWDRGDEERAAEGVLARTLKERASERLRRNEGVPSHAEELLLRQAVLSRVFPGIDRLLQLLDNEEVINLNINGWNQVYLHFRDGSRESVPPIVSSDDELVALIRRCCEPSQRQFNPTHPSVDVQLGDGSRLHAVNWVTTRPYVAIRRHGHLGASLYDLFRQGVVDQAIGHFLHAAVLARINVVVVGEQGSGKSTLTRALASSIPLRERIVTIESVAELGLDQNDERHDDVISYVTRDANVEGKGRVDSVALMREQFRMSAQRTIVGEVLDEELVPMLMAMLSSSGSLCTLHARDSESACSSMVTRALVAPQRLTHDAAVSLIAEAVELIVFMERRAEGYGGRVASIREVRGLQENGRAVQTAELFGVDANDRPVLLEAPSPSLRRRLERLGKASFRFSDWVEAGESG